MFVFEKNSAVLILFTDIYSEFIAPMFKQKLFVQTWLEKLDDDERV